MSPPAMTAAGRGARVTGRPSGGAPGHRRRLRQQAAPARPRRISGPARGRAAAAPAPARHATAARALELIRSLPEHSLLDRLVRGRAWIPVLGVALAGIVAMQVEVLKLGTSAGRWMQRASTLQTKNEALQASVASLADDQRIERLAAGMGMVTPAPTSVSFLPAKSGGAIYRALSNIHAPDPTGFVASLPVVTNAEAGATATQAASPLSAPVGPTSSTATGSTATTTPLSATTSSATTATSTPATAPAASGASIPSQNATSPSAPAQVAPTQSPATGAAGLAAAGNGTATSPAGG